MSGGRGGPCGSRPEPTNPPESERVFIFHPSCPRGCLVRHLFVRKKNLSSATQWLFADFFLTLLACCIVLSCLFVLSLNLSSATQWILCRSVDCQSANNKLFSSIVPTVRRPCSDFLASCVVFSALFVRWAPYGSFFHGWEARATEKRNSTQVEISLFPSRAHPPKKKRDTKCSTLALHKGMGRLTPAGHGTITVFFVVPGGLARGRGL